MKAATVAVSSVGLMAMASICSAGSTATLKVSAQVIRDCTASLNAPTDCTPETLRVQSNYSGRVTIKTIGGDPSVSFVGPQPDVVLEGNTLSVSF